MEKIKLLVFAKSIPLHRKDILNGTYVDTIENRSCNESARGEDELIKQVDRK